MASRKSSSGKPRMGRPPLPKDELRRHRVVVHLTDAERDTLEVLAESQDADLGAVARDILSRALMRARTHARRGE